MSQADAANLLLEEIEYKIDETNFGVWRRFVYPTGELFEEFKSHQRIMGWPLLHYTRGKCPETGKRIIAKGVIAIGRLAIGLVFGLGQFTTGYAAIGQLGFGRFVLAQFGIGQHVWDTRAADPIAQQFFREFVP